MLNLYIKFLADHGQKAEAILAGRYLAVVCIATRSGITVEEVEVIPANKASVFAWLGY